MCLTQSKWPSNTRAGRRGGGGLDCQCRFGSLNCSKETWFLMPELSTPALGPGEQDRKEGELPLIQSLSGSLFHRVSGIRLIFLSSLFRPTTSPVPRSTFQLPGIMIIGRQSKKLGGYFIFHPPLGNPWPRFQQQVTGVDTAWPKGRNMGSERESFGTPVPSKCVTWWLAFLKGPSGWKPRNILWGFRIFSSSVTWSDASRCWSWRSEDHTFSRKMTRPPQQSHFQEIVNKSGRKVPEVNVQAHWGSWEIPLKPIVGPELEKHLFSLT